MSTKVGNMSSRETKVVSSTPRRAPGVSGGAATIIGTRAEPSYIDIFCTMRCSCDRNIASFVSERKADRNM